MYPKNVFLFVQKWPQNPENHNFYGVPQQTETFANNSGRKTSS